MSLMAPAANAEALFHAAAGSVLVRQMVARRAPAISPPASSLDLARRFRPFSCAVPAFHETWYDAMDDPARRLVLLLAPRESAKSSVAITCAEQTLLANRQKRVGIVSKSEGIAVSFLREIVRDFESNEALIGAVGRLKPEKPRTWNSNELVIEGADLGKDVSIFAIGVGGQVTGRRCDKLLIDDIETADTVITPERRARTREWLAKELLPILAPDGEAIVLGTRKHEDDLYSWLLAEGSGWYVLDETSQAILPDGSSYWPERWPVEALLRRKAELDAVNLRAWASEYMNQIIPSETRMFDPQAWPVWHTLPDGLVYVQAWDLAISEKTTADFTAGGTIGVDGDGNLYLVEARRGHWTFDETQRQIAEMGAKYHPVAVGIEAVQYQAAAVQEALRRTLLPIRALRATRTARVGQKTLGGDKVTRARLVEARAAAGKVWRPGAAVPWWPALASELAFFPFGTHDDQVDWLAYATHLAAQSATDWDSAYGLTECGSCGRKYINRDGARACPHCGARNEVEEQDDDLDA